MPFVIKSENTYFDLSLWPGDRGYRRISRPHKSRGYTSYIAIKDDQIIGVLMVRARKYRNLVTVWSCGTSVRPAYSRRGVGKSLWKQMIKDKEPTTIRVEVISDRGWSLIASIKDKYPNIKWIVTNSGLRPLRRLRRQ